MITVFLVDDHEVVRRGVRELIDAEDDLDVVDRKSGTKDPFAGTTADDTLCT